MFLVLYKIQSNARGYSSTSYINMGIYNDVLSLSECKERWGDMIPILTPSSNDDLVERFYLMDYSESDNSFDVFLEVYRIQDESTPPRGFSEDILKQAIIEESDDVLSDTILDVIDILFDVCEEVGYNDKTEKMQDIIDELIFLL